MSKILDNNEKFKYYQEIIQKKSKNFKIILVKQKESLNVSVNIDKISEYSNKCYNNNKNIYITYKIEQKINKSSISIDADSSENKSKEIDLEKRITKINKKFNSIIKSVNPSETEFTS